MKKVGIQKGTSTDKVILCLGPCGRITKLSNPTQHHPLFHTRQLFLGGRSPVQLGARFHDRLGIWVWSSYDLDFRA